MKYQLPQFIETEVKLVGPFTLRQFLWIAGGASLLFVIFLTIKGIWAIVLAVPIIIVSLLFAFLRIHDMPLINYVAYMLSYSLNPKKYLYQNEQRSDIDLQRMQ